VPKTGDIPADHDYRIEIGDGALGFVFNGKSYPSTTQLSAHVGERVHIRLIDTGPEMFHAIHMHGGPFQIVAQDGMPLAIPQWADTVGIAPGQTFDIVWTPQEPGKWMLHCHIFSHSETANGMQGMVTIVNVDPAVVSLPTLPSLPLVPPAPSAPSSPATLPSAVLPALPTLPLPQTMSPTAS